MNDSQKDEKMKEKKKIIKKDTKVLTPTEVKRKKKKRKRILLAAVIVAVIGIMIVVKIGGGNAVLPVTTVQAHIGDVEQTVNISGKVESEETKVYFAQATGKIGTVDVQAGDEVKKGDVLLTYDMEDMERKLEQAQLQNQASNSSYQGILEKNSKTQGKLQEANTNLEVLEKQIADEKAYLQALQESLDKQSTQTANGLAEESFHLNQALATQQKELAGLQAGSKEYKAKVKEMEATESAIALNQYRQQVAGSAQSTKDLQKKIEESQQRLTDYQTYKAEMEAQKSASEQSVLDSYQKMEYSANNQIANLTIQGAEEEYQRAKNGVVADFDGIVTDVTAIEGATVAEGTQLAIIQSSKEVKVAISITKHDLEKIAIGQKAEVTIAGRTYEGTVEKINRMTTMNASGTPIVEAQIHINNPDDKIYLGIDAKAVIYANKAEQVLLLPVEVVNADKEGDFVYVVENGVVVKKRIMTGISSDRYIEVKEGITEEDMVISYISANIEEGVSVMAMPETTTESTVEE